MYSPVLRLLTVLNILQSRSEVTAAQLAEKLEVNQRSARRYITMLQDMGFPIEALRGRYGGYRLCPGSRLPPLMWTEEEALAITLGLQVAQQMGVAGSVPTVTGALAKVERLLPERLREQVQAVHEMVSFNLKTRVEGQVPDFMLRFSMAAYRGQRLLIRYQKGTEATSTRLFDCYGVVHWGNRWYAVGFCHLRNTVRIFRIDRVIGIEEQKVYFKKPDSFNALEYVIQEFAAIPSHWYIVVLLQARMEQLHDRVPPTYATLEATEDGVLLRAYDDSLDHMARFLVSLGCPFTIMQPVALIDEMRSLAEKLALQADQSRSVTITNE
nr:repressor [Thermosporothrix sp. COM3]